MTYADILAINSTASVNLEKIPLPPSKFNSRASERESRRQPSIRAKHSRAIGAIAPHYLELQLAGGRDCQPQHQLSDRGIYFAVEKIGELADTDGSEIALKFNKLPQAKPAVN